MKRVALALLVGLCTVVAPLAPAQSGFTDLEEAPAYRPAVEAIGHLGISDGTECGPDRFCPTDSLQRWVMAVWLVRILDRKDPRSASNRFVDVDPDQWWAPYVERLAALGVTAGCSTTSVRYCPTDPVTRGEMAIFLTRAFQLQPAPPFGFTDTEENTYKSAIDSLAATGITIGCDTDPARYCPADAVTRGQMATFLTRAISTTGVWVRPDSPGAGGTTGPWINTWDRDEVVAASRTEFHRTEPDREFTGNVDACVAGTNSQSFRDSVVSRVNWYRRMAGLDTVTERPEYSSHAQLAALITAANGNLSHYPPSDWECVTPDGQLGARKSNLHWGGAGILAIDGYVSSMVHRRWILFPGLLEVGTGDVGGANALYVVGERNNPIPEVRQPRGFVAWPPAGYVPARTVSGRWSFDLRGAGFANAMVTVIEDTGPLPVRILDRDGVIFRGIVWEFDDRTGSYISGPSGFVSNFGFEGEGRDKCYTITISNVTIAGAVQDPYRYQTCVITLDPH